MLASRAHLLPAPFARPAGAARAAALRRPEAAVSLVAALGALLVFVVLLAPAAPAPVATATPAASFGVLAEPPPPPTATDVPPTATPLPAVDPPATPTAEPTATAIPTATATPVPPTPSPTAAPALTPTRVVQPAKPGAGVPILMYHYIRVNPDPKDTIGYGLSIPPASFAAQMKFLSDHGYRVVSMRALNDYVGTGKLPDEKWVVLTFDDGYRDAYTEALPVLKKYGFQATFFIITDLIDNPRYLTQAQIKEMVADGMEIGDHSASHSELPALGRAQLQREIVDSKALLEKLIGGPVVSFCYPSGHNSLAVRQVVQAAGYASAVTVDPGIYKGKGDRLQIPRVRVYGGITLPEFAHAIGEPPG